MRAPTSAWRHVRAAAGKATAPSTQRRLFSSSPACLDRYGFIGLGQMGFQMAKNLQSKLKPEDTVRLFDINKDAVQKLTAETSATGAGVETAASVEEAARDADYVITVLPEPVHVKGVYKSILDAGIDSSKHPVFIDSSTIDPTTSRAVAATVADAGGQFVDAPMSGGVVGATAGTLTFMLGASDGVVSRVEPLLLLMGKKVLHCGAQGAGLGAKLANNYLLAINNIGAAEALNMGVRLGLDPKVLTGVINVSTGKCWPTEVNNAVPGVIPTSPANRDYAGGFGIALMKKDLKLAIAAAKDVDATLALAGAADSLYETAAADEQCKGRDFSVVYRYLGGKE